MAGEFGEGLRIQDTVLRGGVTGNNQFLYHPPDRVKQQQLIYSYLHKDPGIISTNQIVQVTEAEKDQFLAAVRYGSVFPTTQHRRWNRWGILEAAPSPVSHSAGIDEAIEAVMSDPAMANILERAYPLAPRRSLRTILRDYQGPEMLNDELIKITPAFFMPGLSDTARITSMDKTDRIMHILYGERQAYYEQLRRLMEYAFGVQRPETEPEIRFRRTTPPTASLRRTEGSPQPQGIVELDAKVAALEAQVISLTQERDSARRRASDAERRANDAERLNEGLRKSSSETSTNKLDPSGYYKTLGLDPIIVRDLPEDAIRALIKGARRGLGLVHHPDRTNGDLEKARKVNAAADFLSDPLKRRDYGR